MTDEWPSPGGEIDPEALADLKMRTVTCHTDGCVNCGIPITFVCSSTIFCGGGCGNLLEDVIIIEEETEDV